MTKNKELANAVQTKDIALPDVTHDALARIADLTTVLGIPRDALATNDAILNVWSDLSRLLRLIPTHKISVLHARMCVAISTGLFDSAINYAWNSAMEELRRKITKYGYAVISQSLSKSFDANTLGDMKDIEILELCQKLNLISDEDHFFLDHCREIRNSFSAAHPPPTSLNEDEVKVFISRIARHALANTADSTGIDISTLLKSVKSGEFTEEQVAEWSARLKETSNAQRTFIFSMLHGIYSDPKSNEDTRRNCITLCNPIVDNISNDAVSEIIDRHAEYKAHGDDGKAKASREFFREMGLVSQLGPHELHHIVSSASKNLRNAHLSFNNFYTEPPLAERLLEVTSDIEIPPSAQKEFVETVVMCAIGNPYGVSNAAIPHYYQLAKQMSPNEISILLESFRDNRRIKDRIDTHPSCKRRFVTLVKQLNPKSIPQSKQSVYTNIVN